MVWPIGSHRPPSPGWYYIRQTVIRRSGRNCEVPLSEGGLCGRVSIDVDHIIPVAEGGTDTLDNARMICPTHHAAKTQAEAQRGIERRRQRGRRSTEPHPFDII